MHVYELHTSPAHSCLDNYVCGTKNKYHNTKRMFIGVLSIHRNIVSTVTLGCKQT